MKELKELYEVGFNNGAIETKNKILKTLNRDISFFYENAQNANKILDRIDKIKLPKAKHPTQLKALQNNK